jgi:glycosyltransferase involved in cell wall biosynthesis
LRIALDATYSLDAELTGVGVYSQRLLHGLAARHPEHRFRWCYRSHRWLASFQREIPGNCTRGLLLDSGVRRAEIFHGLNQRLPRRTAVPAIATFHDLFVMTGEYSTREFRERFTAQAREAADRADLIVAVSEFTGRQVRELLGVAPERIRVVPHGTDLPAEALPGAGEREKLILHVGAIQKRKNLARLVEAFAAAPAGWRLVLAGGSGYGAEEVEEAIASSPRRADIETPGYVTNAQLHDYYRRAALFAFPSLDEGFGIPVLEAMAWGLPVITSSRSALPEAAGGAAWLVDPLRAEELAVALRTLCLDEDQRASMTAAGRQRASRASWGEAVSRTWSAYEELWGQRARSAGASR